jgi:tRNA-2-methylthio-N6-dimethylallyladenosine synthase
VPSLRGVEKDRPQHDILSEARALVADGVVEITLLGQNVNAYGVDLGERGAFAKLIREVGAIDGLERLRFMSPHPRDFTQDVIEAMAETKAAMPHLHMPLQSGSDRILQAMRRSYRSDRYLKIIEDVRSAMPDAGITTDIIVGFPGESEEDFQATLNVVREAKFTAAYTFQYSKRPGTPAATMPDQIDDLVMADRYSRLHKLQQEVSGQLNADSEGKSYEVLISDHEGRHDADRSRVNGRTPDFRLVHVESSEARPGDIANVTITESSPNFMLASLNSIRKTRGGDAHEARLKEVGSNAIMMGMPTLAKLKTL